MYLCVIAHHDVESSCRHVGKLLVCDQLEEMVFFLVDEDYGQFCKEEGKEDWERLMEVLDMNQEEWEAKFVPLHGFEDRYDERRAEDDSSKEDESLAVLP